MVACKRILVVDDEPMVLFIFEQALKALGKSNRIVTALSGLEALNEFRKEPFGLVITDLSMPGMDGIELTEAIKALSPNTAVIWITAYGCLAVVSQAVRLGVLTCRDKPIEVHEILRMARDALSGDQ
jgi:DNA-binding NtrC family response regulator